MKLQTLDSPHQITEPGAYRNMPVSAYFADPCPVPSLTQSIAKVLVERSPRHAWLEHPRLGWKPDDGERVPYVKAQVIGDAAHAMLIGRGKTVSALKFDDFRTKAAQEQRSAVETVGHIAILEKHHQQALRLVTHAKTQIAAIPGCEGAFDRGSGEVVIAAEIDGIWLRSMIDWMESPVLCDDAKTTGMSVAPHGLGRMMANAGWDVQAATQERILDVLDPENIGRRKFRFFAVENDEPHALVAVELSEAVMTMGRKKLDYAMDVWRRCVTSNLWPAYPAEIQYPAYPGYAETNWLDREVAYAEANERSRERGPMLTSLAGG